MGKLFWTYTKKIKRPREPDRPDDTGTCPKCSRWHFYQGKAVAPCYGGISPYQPAKPPRKRLMCMCGTQIAWKGSPGDPL